MPLRVAFLDAKEPGDGQPVVAELGRLSEQASQLVLSFAGAYALQYLPTPVARTGADFTLLEAQRWRFFRIVDALVKNGITRYTAIKACFTGSTGLQTLLARCLSVYLARKHALYSFSVHGNNEYTMTNTPRHRGKEFFAFIEHVVRNTKDPAKIHYQIPSLRALNHLAKIRGARTRLKVTRAPGRALTATEVRRYDDAFAEFIPG